MSVFVGFQITSIHNCKPHNMTPPSRDARSGLQGVAVHQQIAWTQMGLLGEMDQSGDSMGADWVIWLASRKNMPQIHPVNRRISRDSVAKVNLSTSLLLSSTDSLPKGELDLMQPMALGSGSLRESRIGLFPNNPQLGQHNRVSGWAWFRFTKPSGSVASSHKLSTPMEKWLWLPRPPSASSHSDAGYFGNRSEWNYINLISHV